MPDSKELLSMLYEMREDPSLRDFQPLINEMIHGIQTPEYDNIDIILKLFSQNILSYHCRCISEVLFQRSAMGMHHKKWYELNDLYD